MEASGSKCNGMVPHLPIGARKCLLARQAGTKTTPTPDLQVVGCASTLQKVSCSMELQ